MNIYIQRQCIVGVICAGPSWNPTFCRRRGRFSQRGEVVTDVT